MKLQSNAYLKIEDGNIYYAKNCYYFNKDAVTTYVIQLQEDFPIQSKPYLIQSESIYRWITYLFERNSLKFTEVTIINPATLLTHDSIMVRNKAKELLNAH